MTNSVDEQPCSRIWDEADTSAWGTAARADFIVCLEQNGPWGRNAVVESHLDSALGAQLDAAVSAAGGRLMLVRRPGRHADDHVDVGHAVLVAACGVQPGQSVGVSFEVSSPAQLLDVDWSRVADADLTSVVKFGPRMMTHPVLLLCTNGTRDICCAVRGRPVAILAASQHPIGSVWEVSHTGGHRFAPTGVLLPWGLTVARLDEALATDLLAMDLLEPRLPEALVGPRHDRGRSCLSPADQAAESALRQHTGERDLHALWVVGGIGIHRDSRRWEITVEREDVGCERLESCGKAPVPVRTWRVGAPSPL